MCFKQDKFTSGRHFWLKSVMAAILKGCSKLKCSKLAKSMGPSECCISKGRLLILCASLIVGQRHLCNWLEKMSPTPFIPSKLSLLKHRDKPFRMECSILHSKMWISENQQLVLFLNESVFLNKINNSLKSITCQFKESQNMCDTIF